MDLPVSLKVMWLGNLYEPQKVEYEINEEDVLYRSQYGFREEHSTQHAIIDIINTIQSNLDTRLFPCGVFIDLKKALDTVDHAISLDKCKHYCFREKINKWFSSYLQDRTQTTQIGSHISESALRRGYT